MTIGRIEYIDQDNDQATLSSYDSESLEVINTDSAFFTALVLVDSYSISRSVYVRAYPMLNKAITTGLKLLRHAAAASIAAAGDTMLTCQTDIYTMLIC